MPVKDLIALVADADMDHAIRGIFTRPKSLRIRELTCDIYRHPQRDPGCFQRSHTFLQPFARQYRYALVMFDRHGSGCEDQSRSRIEDIVEGKLFGTAWKSRSMVVTIDPELEAWVWSKSPIVDEVLGWKGRAPGLRDWLIEKRLLRPDQPKPVDPKRALQEAMRQSGKRRSPAIYQELSKRVSLNRCEDPSFLKLRRILQDWFTTVA